MSGARYAFAELDENAEWRVIDNDSGLARTPASLSGGEQFIASLALGNAPDDRCGDKEEVLAAAAT